MTTSTLDASAEALRYGFGDTTIGSIVVAESIDGVAALFIGDDHTKLLRDLKSVFPGVTLTVDQDGLAETLAKAVALVDAPHQASDLVLDLRGSPVELAIWQALRAIPAGETCTYGALAKILPMPVTAQEVGAACAANRIAVGVPCHRVVKADGSISGYRWGVHRKRRLINMEGVA